MFSNRQETGAKAVTARSPAITRATFVRIAGYFACMPFAILACTYSQQGFIAFGRAATTMLMPTGIAWLLLWAFTVAAFSTAKVRQASAWLGFFLIWTIVGNNFFASIAIGWVEAPLRQDPHPALERRDPATLPLDAVVTLGGAAELKSDGFAEVDVDGERIVSAAQAYHGRATKTIITTGSSTNGVGDPSEVGRDLLVSLGVPPDKIFAIQGANTTEEMKSLALFLSEPPEAWLDLVVDKQQPRVGQRPRIGLITSAFHIPRAMRLAKVQSLELIPLPCAFRTRLSSDPWLASDLIPSAGHQLKIGIAIKEALAKVLGR